MEKSLMLRYNSPASDFNEALPVGNGRIGGMIFGGALHEVIKLNEDSVWSGGPRHRINPDAREGLAEVRSLIKDGNIPEAEKIAFEKLQGVPDNMRHYMPLGNLNIVMKSGGKAKDYSRSLDLSDAVSEVGFSVNGLNYRRSVFVSAPDEVMVIRISADSPASVCLDCFIDGREERYDDNRPCGENMLLFNGGAGSRDGIFFAAVLGAVNTGGTLRTVGNHIRIEKADEVMLVLSARTSFYGEGYERSAVADVEMALKSTWDDLYSRHANDYRLLFDRVELALNDNSGNSAAELPTDRRIQRLRGNELDNKECDRLIRDNKLFELFFNYGRYLMISGSRPGTQPLNLQGIWNEDMMPVRGSKYTVNINTEMNYWCAESCNLSECHLPLFDLLERVCTNGRTAAKEMYGVSKGFVCHHNTDIWGDCAPQDTFLPSTIWPMGGAWLALHIFEHYEYTLDTEFLADKYHILREAAEFFTEYLIEDENGHLVTCPSVSPENTYLTENGVKGCLCSGPSMDSQIITVLFSDVIRAAKILGRDKAFSEKLAEMIVKLPKPETGKYGQIKEWAVDYDEAESGHRHVSQLFALHPSDLITPHKTPRLADAARATLIRRFIHGGGHVGWSCAWSANMWARLYDGRMVYENLRNLITHSLNSNLLNSQPPFQIDGNFGGTAAIAEALLQSCGGEIILLPALPDEWSEGHVKGLRGKGGFIIDMEWSDCKLTKAVVTSCAGGECRLRTNCVASIIGSNDVPAASRIEDGVIVFDTVKDGKYVIRT